MNIAILIFDNVQIIDYTGPYEAFGRRGHAYTVAQRPDPIVTEMGMRVIPNFVFGAEPAPDVLVVPGGGNSGEPGSKPRGVGAQLENEAVIRWVRASADRAAFVLSVCNGAFLVEKAGLLEGLSATTTAGYLEYLAQVAPHTTVVSTRRFVDNGKVITAGGLSAGIDGALHVIERMEGRGVAVQTALAMEYNWEPDGNWTRAALADARFPAAVYEAFAGPGLKLMDVHSTANDAEEVYRAGGPLAAEEIIRAIDSRWDDLGWTKTGGAAGGAAHATTARRHETDGRTWTIDIEATTEDREATAQSGGRVLVTMRIRGA